MDELIQLYAKEKSLSQSGRADLLKQAKNRYGALSELGPTLLFSEDAMLNQHAIVLPKLEAPLVGMVNRYAFSSASITRAYTSAYSGNAFTPLLVSSG